MRLIPYRRLLLPSLVAAAAALGAAPASAQVPTVSPGGDLSDPAAPPPQEEPARPAPQEQPPVIVVGPDGETQVQTPEPEGPAGFYYDDGQGGSLYPSDEPGALGRTGPVPETHTVRTGDTLWDICWFYFNNPWEWPRIWSYNPEITNPHWIYPGDQVRLRAAGEGPGGGEEAGGGEAGPEPQPIESAAGERGGHGWFSIRQLAFVDQQKLEYAARVTGSTQEKLLLSEGDSIYLSYPEGQPPQVGKRYAIYEEQRSVEHPETGSTVGAYVKVIGELEVTSVKKGKKARALVTDSANVIERGHRVGPLKRTFKDVQPTPNEKDLQGTIVAQLEADKLIGARHVVFIDRGASHGVEKGNTLFVVRRGDAYPEPGGRASNRGLDDRRFPARAIGEVLVVQAGEKTSVGLVTLSMQEIEPGDLVLMRKARGGGDR